MLIKPSFKKSLIVEKFQGNYLEPLRRREAGGKIKQKEIKEALLVECQFNQEDSIIYVLCCANNEDLNCLISCYSFH